MNKKLIDFLKAEIEETQTALAFVMSEIAKGSIEYMNIFLRKKTEYEATISAHRATLEFLGEDVPGIGPDADGGSTEDEAESGK